MTVVKESGLAYEFSNLLVSLSSKETFYGLGFFSAAVVNFFVPSGGGQWVIQAPILMPVAKELGLSPLITSLSIAWGDSVTNLIQPFWAIPILTVTKASLASFINKSFKLFLFIFSIYYIVFSLKF